MLIQAPQVLHPNDMMFLTEMDRLWCKGGQQHWGVRMHGFAIYTFVLRVVQPVSEKKSPEEI